ncbi:GntR family transcriptional regulator [Chelativorans salis]|uniref:FCD domain-containing protein n=1 Tax=Chelativorans salis TaxID=2978478 RepID=A0ABT2LI18_9HYPH|nr:FCD domain-containing protein [Chelativorans sp. EGI FJ00035]MCT7374216.1 FCD domain-containing protein [Chelativorans sp. EGI FJ00035]
MTDYGAEVTTDLVSSSEPALEQTLTETCYRRLKQDIISGARPPGERMRIEKLKAIYGIGPTSLREALQRLSADGLVRAVERRGFQVAPLDAAEFLDLNTARIEIDLSALRLSIRAGDGGWEGGVVAAAYRLEKADGLVQSGAQESLDDWERLNKLFHRSLVACPSRWLLRMREMLGEQVERYRRASVYRERTERNLIEEHRQIAEAVLARDEERACRLLAEHYTRTADGLLTLLRSRA